MRKHPIIILIILNILIAACNLPGMAAAPAPTSTSVPPTDTATPIPPSATATVPLDTATPTPPPTDTATITLTPTITDTPGPTATATFAFPTVTVNQQAHCRYGPSKAYLHAADLFIGDTGSVRGRFQNSQWLYVKFDKLKYFCWVAPSVVDVVGDVKTLYFAEVKLPVPGTYFYGPPDTVSAVREDNKVHISWSQVEMTSDKDRGYFLDLFVCQDGAYLWWPISFPDQYTTSYTVKDEKGCAAPSGGVIYTVEKHGYSKPKNILWPAP